MHLIKGEFIGALYAYLRTCPYGDVKDLIEELKSLKQVPEDLLEKMNLEIERGETK
jgi:hypothetical protein